MIQQEGFPNATEMLEEATAMPSAIVQEIPDPTAHPWEVMQMGLNRLRGRMDEAMTFIKEASLQNGPCRCSYAPDPDCLICKARRLLEEWQSQDSPDGEQSEALPIG